jgi:cytochrome c
MSLEPGDPGKEAASVPPSSTRHASTLDRSQIESAGPSGASVLRAAFVIFLVTLVAGGAAYLTTHWKSSLQNATRDMGSRLTAQKAPNRSDPPVAARRPEPQDGAPSPGVPPAESQERLDVAMVLARIADADLDQGASAFKVCTACHPADRSGQARLGSNLWGIVGSPVASHAGFKYSVALHAKGGIWTYERLAEYLHDPRKFAPGTSMAFRGITDNQRMANLLAYMRTLADQPAPLPN